jgi:hypothetical protein
MRSFTAGLLLVRYAEYLSLLRLRRQRSFVVGIAPLGVRDESFGRAITDHRQSDIDDVRLRRRKAAVPDWQHGVSGSPERTSLNETRFRSRSKSWIH